MWKIDGIQNKCTRAQQMRAESASVVTGGRCPHSGEGEDFLTPDQKTMQTSCLGGFSIMWVPKLLLTPVKKLGFLAPKRPNLVKNMHFGHFWPNIGIFCPFRPMPDQNTMHSMCLGVFSAIWLPKLCFLK